MAQVEAGHTCPVSMTHAAVPALRAQPELAAEWEPLLTSLEYDPGLRPPAGKRGALCGMAMTERQGGSDVRANTTRAEPIGGGEYVLTGHKWFCSAPMCDAFLVLAQAPEGLSCFLLPRVLPDGTRNGFRIQRLKDKLGDRSNASSEIELESAWARLVGEEGRGVPTIIEMVNHTRLDCVLGTAAGMRAAVEQATHHAAHRAAFGRLLADQPLMQNVLADLCVESEAATLTGMRLAGAYDRGEQAFARIATAVAKYWVCKRGPGHAAEALECLGGNGYVEESVMPRIYRQQPLQSIWEGSGNVICLDVLRALGRSPETLEPFLAECRLAAGDDARLDAWLRRSSSTCGSRTRGLRDGSSSGWRSRSRPRSSSATAVLPSPTLSALRASAATADSSTGRCPAASTPSGSSSGTAPGSPRACAPGGGPRTRPRRRSCAERRRRRSSRRCGPARAARDRGRSPSGAPWPSRPSPRRPRPRGLACRR